MLKTISIVLALHLAPAAQAKDLSPAQSQQLCKAVIGVDDAVIITVVTWVVLKMGFDALEKWTLRDEVKKLKEQAAKGCGS